MSPRDNPGLDLTNLRQGAVQMHELYTELKGAGFTRSEALELIARTIACSQSSDEDDE